MEEFELTRYGDLRLGEGVRGGDSIVMVIDLAEKGYQ